MYKDVNGKTGMKGLQGTSGKTYGNIKLYSQVELADMLADGITEVVPTPKPVPTPEELLAKAKENKLRYLKEAFVFVSQSPFDATIAAGAFTYDGDLESQKLLNDAVTRVAVGWVPGPGWYWKTYDNQRPETTADDLEAISAAMADAGETAWLTKDTLGQAVKDATTVEEIDGIRDDQTGEVTGGIWWPWPDGVDPRLIEEEPVV